MTRRHIFIALGLLAAGCIGTAAAQLIQYPIRNLAYLDGAGNAVLVSTTNALPTAAGGAIKPTTVIDTSVSCGSVATQLPTNALQGTVLLQLPPSPTNPTVFVGNASVSTSSAHVDEGGGLSINVDNTDRLYCLCSGCTQTLAILGEGP